MNYISIFYVNNGKLSKVPTSSEFRSMNTLIVSGIPDGTLILSEPSAGAYVGMEVTTGDIAK